jgi:hypothetical protein
MRLLKKANQQLTEDHKVRCMHNMYQDREGAKHRAMSAA